MGGRIDWKWYEIVSREVSDFVPLLETRSLIIAKAAHVGSNSRAYGDGGYGSAFCGRIRMLVDRSGF